MKEKKNERKKKEINNLCLKGYNNRLLLKKEIKKRKYEN